MPPIFAQVESLHPGWLALIIPGTIALTKLVDIIIAAIQKYRDDRRQESQSERANRKEDESDTIAHYEKLNERLDRERKECLENEKRIEEELRQTNDQLYRERIRAARMLVWMRYMEEVMRREKIHFKAWDEVVKETPDIQPENGNPPVRSRETKIADPETTVE